MGGDAELRAETQLFQWRQSAQRHSARGLCHLRRADALCRRVPQALRPLCRRHEGRVPLPRAQPPHHAQRDAAGGQGARRTDAGRTRLLAGGCAQRRHRHVVCRSGAGGDLDQPRIGEVRQRREHRGHLVAAFVGRERQDLRHADGRVGLHAGRRRRGTLGRLSRLGAQPRIAAARHHGQELRAALLDRAQGARHPRRTGVRTLPREVSRPGDGLLRTDAPRRPLARRAARDCYRPGDLRREVAPPVSPAARSRQPNPPSPKSRHTP